MRNTTAGTLSLIYNNTDSSTIMGIYAIHTCMRTYSQSKNTCAKMLSIETHCEESREEKEKEGKQRREDNNKEKSSALR